MPERIAPTVISGEDYVNELERLVRGVVRRLDDGEKAILRDSLMQSARYVKDLGQMGSDDPHRAATERLLKAERTAVENLVWAEARERADELLDGVIDASMDLILSNALRILAFI